MLFKTGKHVVVLSKKYHKVQTKKKKKNAITNTNKNALAVVCKEATRKKFELYKEHLTKNCHFTNAMTLFFFLPSFKVTFFYHRDVMHD